MRVIKLCALAVLVGLVGLACQSAPEDAGNAAAGETPAANATAATDTANATAAADTANVTATAEPAADQRQRPERPQPNAPRAEGDMLAELLAGGDYLLLDVRRPEELEERGTVEGYLNIPIEELADRLDEVPRDRAILTA